MAAKRNAPKSSPKPAVSAASSSPKFIAADELEAIVSVMARHDVTELSQSLGDHSFTIRRGPAFAAAPIAPAPIVSLAHNASPPPSFSLPPPAANVERPAPPPAAESVADEGTVFVTSPLVGTFYRAPSPDAPSFVDVGTRIRAGQRLCIVEAMKLMNEIEAEIEGTIVEIMVENGKPVEYGQKLFRVKKN